MPIFTWKFSLVSKCPNCSLPSQRSYESNPFFVISTDSLQKHSGLCSDVIRKSLKDYIKTCSIHKREIVGEKIITSASNYYCCVLDYAEELMRGTLKIEDFPNLVIDSNFVIDNLSLELEAIVYFQEMHYTVHVRGAFIRHCCHPEAATGFIMMDTKTESMGTNLPKGCYSKMLQF